MRAALTTGIMDAAKTATGFSDSNVFWGRRNMKTVGTYLLISGIESLYDLDGVNVHEPARVQFSVIGHSQADVQTGMAALLAVYDVGEGNITVSDWTVVESKRFPPGIPPEPFGKIWRMVENFHIWIIQAR